MLQEANCPKILGGIATWEPGLHLKELNVLRYLAPAKIEPAVSPDGFAGPIRIERGGNLLTFVDKMGFVSTRWADPWGYETKPSLISLNRLVFNRN